MSGTSIIAQISMSLSIFELNKCLNVAGSKSVSIAGSMIASLGVLCCAKTGDMTFKEKCGSCCTVFGIGVLQLLLVACFLIGWVWSCIWGITFIGMSGMI